MQIGRIEVFPTTTTISNISPPEGTAVCGDLITFTVHVDGYVAPDGYVIIQDVTDGYVVGHAPIFPISGTRSTATINAVLGNGSGDYVAFYPLILQDNPAYDTVKHSVVDRDVYGRVSQSFAKSQSPAIHYDIGFVPTMTAISTLSGTSFCYHEDFTVTAAVTLGGSPVTDGYVEFRLFHQDGYTIDELGVGQLDMSGIASAVIPAGSTIPSNDYHIQAIYLGSGCKGISNSPGGIDGAVIHSIRLDPTVTVMNPVPLGSNSRSGPIMLLATVSGTALTAPSIGIVTFTTTAPSIKFLGTSYISNGMVPHTLIGPISGGQVLPQSTIHVDSTDGFASSGTIFIETNAGNQSITYTGITTGGDPSFTGCVGGTPGTTISVSGNVSAFAVPAGTFTSATTWSTKATYTTDGYCYATSVSSIVGIDIVN